MRCQQEAESKKESGDAASTALDRRKVSELLRGLLDSLEQGAGCDDILESLSTGIADLQTAKASSAVYHHFVSNSCTDNVRVMITNRM